MPPPARPPARLTPSLLVAVLGGVLLWFNVGAASSQARLLTSGRSVHFTVERCVRTGPDRACVGSYQLDGQVYRDRLLLGHGQARPGENVTARVDRRHPGDASAPGIGGLIEAALLALAGAALASVGMVRARGAWRRRGERPPKLRARPWKERARVWETPAAPAPAEDRPLP